MRIFYAAVITTCLLIAVLGTAQLAPEQPQSEQQVRQVVLENELVRITRIQQSMNAPFSQQRLDNDVVSITLPLNGAALVAAEKTGVVRFHPRGARFDLPKQDASSGILLVEIKRHWDAEVKACTEPLTCVRQIRSGGTQIGETQSLFSNGFLSGFIHRLEPGGTLTSSYFSAKGTDSVVYVALTPLHVNFGGRDEDLKAGQAYFTNATEVETTADTSPAAWIVIRIHVPKA